MAAIKVCTHSPPPKKKHDVAHTCHPVVRGSESLEFADSLICKGSCSSAKTAQKDQSPRTGVGGEEKTGAAVKSTCCSSRGPKLSVFNTHICPCPLRVFVDTHTHDIHLT